MAIVLIFLFFVGITLVQNNDANEDDFQLSGIGVRIKKEVCN